MDRKVKVVASAVFTDYTRGVEEAAKKTRELGTAGEKLNQQKAAFETLGRASLAFGTVLAAGVGIAIAKFADFDQALSYVQASTHESAENMGLLRQAAIDAGASTVFSATESANAIEELAKAGLSTAEVLKGGLKGSLDLAAAGGLGVARAAEIAAVTLNQFNLEGDQASHVADLLAAGAGKAVGSVDDIAQALNQSGLVAAQFGLSVEETVGSLALFAKNSLVGSDAGTSFRNMLIRLANPTKEVKDLMAELGIEAYDASGQFIGVAGLAGELQDALGGLSEEQQQTTLAMIFGTDAIRSSSILLKEGAEGVRDMTAAVDDQGYAAETAALRLDNLKGDVEALGGAFDTALIQSGSGANEALRFLTQSATDALDVFNDLPLPLQQAALGVAAIASAGTLGYGMFLTLVPKIAEFNEALKVMSPRTQAAARSFGLMARAGGVAVGIGLLTVALAELDGAIRGKGASGEDLANALATSATSMELFNKSTIRTVEGVKPLVDNVDELHRALAIAETEASGFFGFIGANTTFDQGNRAFGRLREGFQALGKEMAAAPETIGPSLRMIQEEANLTNDELNRLISLSPDLKQALTEQATAAGIAATDQNLLELALKETVDPTEKNTAAIAALSGQAVGATETVEDLANTIRDFGSAQFDVRAATRGFEQAIDDLSASITDNGTTLDLNEQKGRDNQAAIDDLAKSALDLAAATYTQTGSQEEATAVLETGRGKLLEMLGQFGITGQAAEDYADSLGLIPENIDTSVTVLKDDAQAAIDNFVTLNNGRKILIRVDSTVDTVGPLKGGYAFSNADGGMYSYANGGFGSGMYTGGTPLYKFAEKETGWEAFISGKASEKQRNIGIWQEAGQRLGVSGAQSGGVQEVHVHAAPGMDEDALVRKAVRAVERLIK